MSTSYEDPHLEVLVTEARLAGYHTAKFSRWSDDARYLLKLTGGDPLLAEEIFEVFSSSSDAERLVSHHLQWLAESGDY